MWIYIENGKDKILEIEYLSMSHSTYKAIFVFHPWIKIAYFYFNNLHLYPCLLSGLMLLSVYLVTLSIIVPICSY